MPRNFSLFFFYILEAIFSSHLIFLGLILGKGANRSTGHASLPLDQNKNQIMLLSIPLTYISHKTHF